MKAAMLAEMARREAAALHAFFSEWFRDAGGTVDFAICERVLAPDFSMVTPDGRSHDRATVIDRLRRARGSAPADFAIVIDDCRTVWQQADAVLLEFTEHQYSGGRTTSRRSSGLFSAEPSAPHGVVWRHVHETWVADERDI